MTLKQLEDRVLAHFNYSTDAPSSEARSRIRGHLNQWHRRLLSKPGLGALRLGQVTVTSTANVPTVALPSLVSRVLGVQDTANQQALEERTLDWYRVTDPSPTTHPGTPSMFVRLGGSFLATQSAASGVWVVSSSASDTFRVYVEGASATALKQATVLLNGTTRVAVGSDTDWLTVGLSLSQGAVGTISVYNAAVNGTLVLSIPVGQQRYRAEQIALVPCPATALSYTVDVDRVLTDLENASDTPWLPDDYHWLLEQGAKVSEYERLDDSRMMPARQELEIGTRELRQAVAAQALIVPGSRQTGYSRINGWCPADHR